MIKKFYKFVNDNHNDDFIALSVAINLIMFLTLVALIIIKPIVFLLWLPYKIFTMLIIYYLIFNTLKYLKDKKINKDDIIQINKDIKYFSDTFIFNIIFSNTLLFSFIFYYISGLPKFSWKDFAKYIEIKADNFNNYISNKIQNKFLIKEDSEIIKESYRD